MSMVCFSCCVIWRDYVTWTRPSTTLCKDTYEYVMSHICTSHVTHMYVYFQKKFSCDITRLLHIDSSFHDTHKYTHTRTHALSHTCTQLPDAISFLSLSLSYTHTHARARTHANTYAQLPDAKICSRRGRAAGRWGCRGKWWWWGGRGGGKGCRVAKKSSCQSLVRICIDA